MIVTWLIFGALIGFIATLIDGEFTKTSILAGMILGVLGAVLGGVLGHIVLGLALGGFNIPSIAIAVLGALFLLFAQRFVNPKY